MSAANSATPPSSPGPRAGAGGSGWGKPLQERWFEDFIPGAVYEFGHAEVTASEIIDFARRFDPQPMHVDPEAAARGPFDGLIASGWHTAGLMMRLFVDNFLPGHASLASPGIDELRWTRPVRPGDILRLRVSVVEATRSRSKPDRGMIRTLIEVLNQSGDVVMTLKPMNLLRCRPPLPSASPSAADG
ncbi:MAG TPA: MaoC family dehydratase [Stellaceae bacterium]|nr:MaoC family dehydratase [Stellaceae bacterium]